MQTKYCFSIFECFLKFATFGRVGKARSLSELCLPILPSQPQTMCDPKFMAPILFKFKLHLSVARNTIL